MSEWDNVKRTISDRQQEIMRDAKAAIKRAREDAKGKRVELIRELAASEKTMMEAASILGITYGYINVLALRHGIKFKRPFSDALSERNNHVVERYEAGETLQSIGNDLKITRERVRQVVEKSGATPFRAKKLELYDAIATAVQVENLSAPEAAQRFDTKVGIVLKACKMHNVKARRDYRYDTPEIEALAEEVRDGKSINEASSGNHAIARRLARYCEVHGIESAHKARWRDMKPRQAMILAMRPKSSWAIVAAAVSAMEGAHVGGGAMEAWAARHMRDYPQIFINLQKPTRAQRTPYVRKTVKPLAAEVILAPTLREAAKLNRGRAPASAIAAAYGVTRNSVIGLWYRMRRDGEIT